MHKKYILVTAALAVGAGFVMLSGEHGAKGEDPRLRKPIFASDTFSEISNITIAQAEQKAVLEKSADGEWQVIPQSAGGTIFPADAKQVAALVDSLEKVKIQELLATKKASWTGMGLDAPKVLTFKAGDKDRLVANFGDARTSGGQFIAFDGEEKAYATSEAVTLNLDASSWELKTLLNIKAEAIKSVAFLPAAELKKTPAKVSREKVEDPFKVEALGDLKPVEATVTSVGSVLEEITFLKRLDLSNEESKTAMLQASRLVVDLFDGRVVNGRIGRIDGAQARYFIQLEVTPGQSTAALDLTSQQMNKLMASFAFETSNWIGERMSRSLEDFIEKKEPVSPAASKAEKKPKKASAPSETKVKGS